MSNKASSLYVHIPFCESICGYCDFCKVIYKKEWAESYLPALFAEIASYGEGPYKTIYVGGGTPTSLRQEQLSALLSFLNPYLDKGGEFTVEANPESLSKEKALIMAKYGVNRVSMGMQTVSPRLRQLLGRRHTFEDVQKAVGVLLEAGITNINVDWMYALPGETNEEFEVDRKAILSLNVDHISAYSLILEEGTTFKAKGLQEENEERQAEMYEWVVRVLKEAGYERYEVSNFCKNGKKSRHNLAYWKDERYVGCGLGAAGYIGDIRYKNTRSLKAYLAGEIIAEKEEVTPKDDREYFFLTNLRLEEGFALSSFKERFGTSFLSEYKEPFEKLEKQGLLIEKEGNIKATDRGFLLLDTILRALF